MMTIFRALTMEDFRDLFENRHHRKNSHDFNYNHSSKYNRYLHRESKYEPHHRTRHERENFHISQSTFCVPQHAKNPSKSTLCMPYYPRSNSKSTLHPSKKLNKPVMDDDISSLPYYIVPVLYVPHKPLYEAKQVLEPQVYKAYHCRSKNQMRKDPNPSISKSVLNLYNKKNKKDYDYPYIPKMDKYNFECYDEYFRRCIEDKKSSSDISFCTDKSYCHLPLTPKLSCKFPEEPFDLAERRKSISKDFPELFGLHSSKTTNYTFRPRTGEEEPTWDSPRTTNALIETEMAIKSCISAQTSFETLKLRTEGQSGRSESQGTQTMIMDIRKNVLVLPNDNSKRSMRKDSIPEEVPKSIYDGKVLKPKFSESQLDKGNRKPFVRLNFL